MTDHPSCLSRQDQFPHKAEVLAAINNGAHVRRDSRSAISSSLVGTYQIRLRIAKDLISSEPLTQHHRSVAQDMEFLVNQLNQYPDAPIRVWYIHGESGDRYMLMENEQTEMVMGCLVGRV
ncbi:hypothetical protein [Dyella caseinilytica]|uniref:Uncharacterized protein n=1 Tax=Dyella caseinilytica TaxID=1849581 RepID=A0ABX7GUD7_9GAMM|nr:hypothetical protein [Dyella caseinilytica]QRN53668.1 hypothetical protein ISN74_20090 [Dyella caseinilytica]GFZ88354.1 hypothetical protein GCM10011408_03780 [Dyella caseinilytica]